MRRRQFPAAAASGLALPAVVRAAGATTLRFIPQIDLAFLDPHWTTANVTRGHGYLVFDTLYGQDATFTARPQMVQGHVVDNDGKQWTLTLRPGLMWHDGTPVLARDCVASIRRWAARDAFGGALMAATDDLSAPDDRTIRFRLKRPFPLLPQALGKLTTPSPVMMPERLAKTDPFTQVTEMVGSGPFRFVPDERVPGARNVYQRFDKYVPRADDQLTRWNGPRVPKSPTSNGWSGPPCRTTAARPAPCRTTSRTGGRTRPPICCRCCGASAPSRWTPPTRPATPT